MSLVSVNSKWYVISFLSTRSLGIPVDLYNISYFGFQNETLEISNYNHIDINCLFACVALKIHI